MKVSCDQMVTFTIYHSLLYCLWQVENTALHHWTRLSKPCVLYNSEIQRTFFSFTISLLFSFFHKELDDKCLSCLGDIFQKDFFRSSSSYIVTLSVVLLEQSKPWYSHYVAFKGPSWQKYRIKLIPVLKNVRLCNFFHNFIINEEQACAVISVV